MKLNSFPTLKAAHEHSETIESIFNSNEVVGFLLRSELYLYFKNSLGEIHQAFYDRIKTYSRFDFTSSLDGQGNIFMINKIIASESENEGLQSKLVGFRDICIAEAVKTTFPFAEATTEDWNKSQLEAATLPESVSYEKNDFVIKTRQRDLVIDVLFTEQSPFDVRVDIKVLLETTTPGQYLESSTPIATPVFIKKNEMGRFSIVSREFSQEKKLKFSAVCSHNLKYTLAIREI